MEHEQPAEKWKSKCLGANDCVNVPWTGWYGFCLELPDETNKAIHVLRVRTGDDCPEKEVSLPFQLDGQPLRSLLYGKALFFEQNSAITMKSKDELVKWQLVVHRFPTREFVPPEFTLQALLSDNLRKPLVCFTCSKGFGSLNGMNQHIASAHSECLPPLPEIWRTPLKVLYSDSFLAVVDKPQGMSVQGDTGRTLLKSDLLLRLADPSSLSSSKPPALWPDCRHDKVLTKPVPVHRLDAPTGGILVLAKTKVSERCLRNAFAERTTKKRYRALLYGKVADDEGCVDSPVSKKPATSRFAVVQRLRSKLFGWLTLVDFFPVTGRRHQLRRHAQLMGHSICGDQRYQSMQLTEEQKQSRPCSRLCLWAVELSIPHPSSAEMRTFELPAVEWLETTIRLEAGAWCKEDGTIKEVVTA